MNVMRRNWDPATHWGVSEGLEMSNLTKASDYPAVVVKEGSSLSSSAIGFVELGSGCSSRTSIIDFAAAATSSPSRLSLARASEQQKKVDPVESVCSVEPLMGWKLGKKTFESLSSPGWKTTQQKQGEQIFRCQVEGCDLDLGSAREYHRKRRVCERHFKSSTVVVRGRECRFCQQCSRFHHLSEFDQKKRSCRRRLSGHNSRRRKSLLARTTLLPSSCSGATASLSFLIPPTSSSSESAWSYGALQMDSSPGQSRLLQCSARSCEGHSRASREGCFVCAADQRAAAEAGVPRQLFRASPVSTIFTSSCL